MFSKIPARQGFFSLPLLAPLFFSRNSHLKVVLNRSSLENSMLILIFIDYSTCSTHNSSWKGEGSTKRLWIDARIRLEMLNNELASEWMNNRAQWGTKLCSKDFFLSLIERQGIHQKKRLVLKFLALAFFLRTLMCCGKKTQHGRGSAEEEQLLQTN